MVIEKDPDIQWRIVFVELGYLIIQYSKKVELSEVARLRGIADTPIWITVGKANLSKEGSRETFEIFPTMEDAEQTLELLMQDFGGYQVDR